MTTTENNEIEQTMPRPATGPRVVSGLVIALAIAAGALFWFFGGDAPDEVDLAATAESVSETSDAGSAEAVRAGGIEGTWTVDRSVGDFAVDDEAPATFAGFRVEEVLESIGSTTAVGRTPGVSGTITIDGTTLTAAELSVDLTSIVSDESRRDDNIQSALNTGANPEASFVLTDPIELGDGAAEGEHVSVTATGELTINGVTHTVEIPLEAQLVDGLILVTGSTDIVFPDYDVAVPSVPIVLSVEDHGTLEFQIWLSA